MAYYWNKMGKWGRLRRIISANIAASAVTLALSIAMLMPALLLPASVQAQVEKPDAAVAAVGTIGKISEARKGILLNRLLSELSKQYNLVSQEEYALAEEKAFEQLDAETCTAEQCIQKIQEILQVERLFVLQVIKDEELTQVTLTLVRMEDKIVRSKDCEKCGAKELGAAIADLSSQVARQDGTLSVARPSGSGPGSLTLVGLNQTDELKLDGKAARFKPDGFYVLPAGKHGFFLSREGFEPLEKEITVQSGLTVIMELEKILAPFTGRLRVSGTPKGAKVRISGGRFTHAERTVELPATLDLPVGDYEVEVSRENYVTERFNANVKEEGDTEVAAGLETERMNSWRWKRNLSFIGAGIGLAYFYLENQAVTEANDKTAEQESLMAAAANEENAALYRASAESYREQSDTHYSNAQTGLGLALLLGAYATWVLLEPPGEPPELSLLPYLHPGHRQGGGVALTLRW